MPKLLVIEPFQHQEVLFRWAELWRDSDWEVHFWVNPELLADCPASLRNVASFHWTARPDGQDWRLFLQQQQQRLSEMDLILWLTLGQRYDLPLLVPVNIPIMTVVHNVASLWDISLGKRLTWPMRLRSWRAHLTGYYSQRQDFLDRQQTFVFPTEELRQAALPHISSTQKSIVVPFVFQGPARLEAPPVEHLQIVIPGAVRTDKKDYSLVFRVLAELAKTKRLPVRLILLGPCTKQPTRAWLRSWQERLKPAVELSFYDQLISEEEYQRSLRESHLVLLPLKPYVTFGTHWEKLGRTKIAGGVQDAIYHRLPLLLPDFYRIAEPLSDSIHYFSNEESLLAALVHWLPKLPIEVAEQQEWSRDQLKKQLLAALNQALAHNNRG